MGKEKKLVWKKSKSSLFETFAIELMESTKEKVVPTSGDQDLQYATELWQDRLQRKGLDLDYDFMNRGAFTKDDPRMHWKGSDDRYINSMNVRSCELTRTVQRGGKRIYKKAERKLFYQFSTDVKEGAVVGEDLYTCPNCSAVATIASLQQGCEYCGTCFEMDDLFPKVTNYFFVPDTSGTEEENKRDMLNRMLPCGAVIFLITLLTGLASGDNTFLVLFAAVLGGVFGGAIMGWLLMLVSVLGSVGSQAKDTLGMGFNVFGSSGKFKKKMQQYSPEFSYEYFTAKVISLAKMLIFAKNVEELPVYVGDGKGELFPDIIDATYHGGVALKEFTLDGDYAKLIVEAYMEDLHDVDGRIKRRIDKFRIHLRKNVTIPIDYQFSIKKIQCKNCNASFDATKIKSCPSCGTLYEIGDDDWVVTQIERK
ncbi:MAG: hypothetical protein J6C01_03395 [Lachnospiraceae bacterium]|nr:hypothetical protein [Lachnospiraceae bacterium]